MVSSNACMCIYYNYNVSTYVVCKNGHKFLVIVDDVRKL